MSSLQVNVRLYDQARTAHLERAGDDPPTSLLYATRRYDFDAALAERVGACQAGSLRAAHLLWRSDVHVLEVTEPAYLAGAGRAALCIATLRVRHALHIRQRPLVVTYAIGNSDPRREYSPRSLRERASFRAKWLLSRIVWRWTDRVAFGTPMAAETYRVLYGVPHAGQDVRMVPALPAACSCTPRPRIARAFVFLGAFVPRKGLSLLLEAWPATAGALEGATLQIIGKGPLLAAAVDAAHADPRVSVLVDPPRAAIHESLREASVLVLPSQPSATWREQVGLPIVEALQHGCTVVTTDETGLAPWLGEHGHYVLPAHASSSALADALVRAASAPVVPAEVLASLPDRDGRAEAHAWLFRAPAGKAHS